MNDVRFYKPQYISINSVENVLTFNLNNKLIFSLNFKLKEFTYIKVNDIEYTLTLSRESKMDYDIFFIFLSNIDKLMSGLVRKILNARDFDEFDKQLIVLKSLFVKTDNNPYYLNGYEFYKDLKEQNFNIILFDEAFYSIVKQKETKRESPYLIYLLDKTEKIDGLNLIYQRTNEDKYNILKEKVSDIGLFLEYIYINWNDLIDKKRVEETSFENNLLKFL